MDHTDPAVERIRVEIVARKFLCSILALIGVWVGITMMTSGAPSFLEAWFSPWSRYAVGGVAFLFGMIASLGALWTDRTLKGWWAQVIGMTGLTLWYFGMAVAYIGLVIEEGAPFVGPGKPLDPESTGRVYVPFVYLGLVVMTATPLAVLLRLSRKDVMGGRPGHDEPGDPPDPSGPSAIASVLARPETRRPGSGPLDPC